MQLPMKFNIGLKKISRSIFIRLMLMKNYVGLPAQVKSRLLVFTVYVPAR
jgi:hypothetical protein